ncbi:MAG: hypothetical protein PHU46_05375 [Rhodocyclaceae bacterium]|nr:hypothetical protein [Rhodocyclaceae bacterium]
MPDMLDYKILRAEAHSSDDRRGTTESAIAKLEKLVRTHIAEGWEPVGGICAEHVLDHRVFAYSQAMIRREYRVAATARPGLE